MFNQSRVKIMTLPAKIDRSENQNNLVAKFYDEYAAFNYDEYQLDYAAQQVYNDASLGYEIAMAKLAALDALTSECFEFNPS